MHKHINANAFLDANGFTNEAVHGSFILFLSDVACLKVRPRLSDGLGLRKGANGRCWEGWDLHALSST